MDKNILKIENKKGRGGDKDKKNRSQISQSQSPNSPNSPNKNFIKSSTDSVFITKYYLEENSELLISKLNIIRLCSVLNKAIYS